MLILTEKPSVAQSFGNALSIPFDKSQGFYTDGSTEITNCVGHLYELAKPEDYDESYKHWAFELLPIIPENYIYNQNEETAKQIKKVTNPNNNEVRKPLKVNFNKSFPNSSVPNRKRGIRL